MQFWDYRCGFGRNSVHSHGKVAESFSNQYFSRLVKYLFIVLASSAFSDNSFFFFPVSISSFEFSPLLLTNVCGYQAFYNKNKETRYFCTEFLKHPLVDFSVVNL